MAAQIVAHGGTLHVDEAQGKGYGFTGLRIGAQILRRCGVRQMRLITTSERNISALSGFGLEVVNGLIPEPFKWEKVKIGTAMLREMFIANYTAHGESHRNRLPR